MAQKPSIPKGTRDFSPQEMVRRNYIFDTIKQVFQRYGYLPIETPAMENLSTLMGKYGEEGDKLIFKILNSGDFMSKVREAITKGSSQFDLSTKQVDELRSSGDFEPVYKFAYAKAKEKEILEYAEKYQANDNSKKISSEISEKALRYDLTVPFARYVVQHQSEITFPFKRYQIQPVWRADKPQKGRYREFYQCDADVIGSNSLINEVELVQLIDEVFANLKIPVIIKINNRKILQALGIAIGEENRIVDITVALDKYDKIGDGIYLELEQKNFSKDSISKLKKFTDDFTTLKEIDKIPYLKKIFENIPIGMKGIAEMDLIFTILYELDKKLGKSILDIVNMDLSLARGLNYYTGAIFEVKVDGLKCKSDFKSSITGGGRYDDLTGIFGLPNMSGVGISFGADRIYDVLEELNLFPESVSASTKLLFAVFNEYDQGLCLPLLALIRKEGINSEIYPNTKADAKKQFAYAESKKIPFVVTVKDGVLTLKNILNGEREELTVEKIIEKLK